MPDYDAISTRPLGDTAVLVTRRDASPAWAGFARRRLLQELPPGVHDLVPAFSTLGVYFHPDETDAETVVARALKSLREVNEHVQEDGRLIELPVCYGGEHGPDIAEVAERAGISIDEVIRRHAAAEYAVGAVGFQPGFPYLLGLPPELQTPRRDTPRTSVPAGSVGIGGAYTGVYPAESPGGWNLIGRTPERLFDPNRTPACLLAVGDRVRLLPVPAAELARCGPPPSGKAASPPGEPVLRLVSGHAACSLRSLPTYGEQHAGVGPGGAFDLASHAIANALVGGTTDGGTNEASLNGPVLEALREVDLALAGALPPDWAGPRRVRLAAGEQLDLRHLTGGCRSYVATPGGFTGIVEHHAHAESLSSPLAAPPRWSLNHPARPEADADGVFTLRTLPGPHAEVLPSAAQTRFTGEVYRVTSCSDRTGVRCEGPAIAPQGAEDLASIPIVTGAVQIPPGGQPIVLGPDRSTLGGYPIIAVVISADWPLLAQLRPGDRVRFTSVTDRQAADARHREIRSLAKLFSLISVHLDK